MPQGLRARLPLSRYAASGSGRMLLRSELHLRSRVPLPASLQMSRDMNELHALLESHRGELVAFVRRRAGHLVDPEDVVHQAAIRALARSKQLRDPARGRAWIFRIVRNVLADELRALGLPVPESRPGPEPEPEPERGDTCRCALGLTRSLEPEYRAILERGVLDDKPVTALAGELGVTPNNAMVRLHRARRALRELLVEHCGTTSTRSSVSCACEERGCSAIA